MILVIPKLGSDSNYSAEMLRLGPNDVIRV
jgi:hypothetical protein